MTVTALNAKISEVENKILSISSLVKRTDHDNKIKDIEEKYFTTADCNKFASGTLGVRIRKRISQ